MLGTNPKTSFNALVKWAKEHGVNVERNRTYLYNYWRDDDHGTLGEAKTLIETYLDIEANFIK